ncbi:hypothetical protein [Ideonella sp.]
MSLTFRTVDVRRAAPVKVLAAGIDFDLQDRLPPAQRSRFPHRSR